ncbi:MAG: GNAT family N-acetyltransferase [Alphaproteobacteria bacterium]|nr:GNAT family N-acetyltransferase [Alphaproteobacteria bacterium]
MSLSIEITSPLTPEARAMIEASEAALREVFPPEECFSFSPEELANARTVFLMARYGGVPVGCIALVDMGGYGEMKRMYVEAPARGRGIAAALLTELEQHARAKDLPIVRLETGHDLDAAVALYRRFGYAPCAPFGGYPDIASNLFMEKRLGG